MVAMEEEEEVVAGCVAALAEDAYDMVEVYVDEVEIAGVVDECEEIDKDNEDEDEEEEEEEVDNDEVDDWPDGTE